MPESPDHVLDDQQTIVTSGDGLVTAVVDGAGRLTQLTFDPKAMRRGSTELAETVRGTVAEALDTARKDAAERLRSAAPPLPDQQELLGVLTDMQATATSKLSQMSSVLDQLIARTEGPAR